MDTVTSVNENFLKAIVFVSSGVEHLKCIWP